MILQALVKYYEELLAQGEISEAGWSKVEISFGLDLDCEGSVIGLLPFKVPRLTEKKRTDVPRTFNLPQPVKRSVDIKSNFLYDNATYLLGVDEKGKQDRSVRCFQACKTLHHRILNGVSSEAAKAVLKYFEHWKPDEVTKYSCIMESWKELMRGNIILCYEGKPVVEDAEVRSAWQEYLNQDVSDEPGVCLVTGKQDVIARLHPSVKGVIGAQTTGTSLVSFNEPAFCSYGKEQGANAAVGKYAAFAYTTALNKLLSDREHSRQIGDTTVVCWAEDAQEIYREVTMAALFGINEDDRLSDRELSGILAALQKGEYVETPDWKLDPDQHFYLLGLAPNSARLVVRFFYMDTFGKLMENISRHYRDLEIVRPKQDTMEHLPLWRLLGETVNRNARNKSPSPQMSADTMQAVITGKAYPHALLNGAMMRIRAERRVTRGQAAIIKAYYLRHENKDCPKEVLHMELNEQCTDTAYTLGRLFAVLEHIQQAANPEINTTIRDKYFNAAAATPARIFPVLINLAQKHLRKLQKAYKISFDKKIGELSEIIGEKYPLHLNLPQQGSFQLGYYCQTQKRYQKKEETK